MHGDNHLDGGRDLFLSGLEWDLDGFDIPVTEFEHHFKPAERFQINYHLALTDYHLHIAILVSACDHCLADLLYRHSTGELLGDIVMMIKQVSPGPVTEASGQLGGSDDICKQDGRQHPVGVTHMRFARDELLNFVE